MKKLLSFLALIMSFGATLLSPAQAALPIVVDGQQLPSLAPMLEQATPAVVNIATESVVRSRPNPLMEDPIFRRFFDFPEQPRERRSQSLGSGVIVDAERGYLITNHHVIEGADSISVTLRDGRRLNAELIGSDSESDIAVIRIDAKNLTALPIANSDAMRVGDFVVAIGNPFGLGQTVTSGIVSALGRSNLGIEGYEDFIQTDASINPGNSGGALVNLRGELVGINTAIIAPSGGNVGIGFAIPTNMAINLMDQLVTHGEVERGQLGVSVQDLTPELARAFGIGRNQGALIAQVLAGSAAEKAGLRQGDVVLKLNGRSVRSGGGLRNAVGLLRVGEAADIEYLRDEEIKTTRVQINQTEAAKSEGAEIHPRLTGAQFSEIPEDSPFHGRLNGVLIMSMERNSPAHQAGLLPGDIITGVNRQEIAGLKELAGAVSQSRDLLLNLQRGSASLYLMMR